MSRPVKVHALRPAATVRPVRTLAEYRRWTRDALTAYVGSGRYAAVDFLPAPDERSEPGYVLARVQS